MDRKGDLKAVAWKRVERTGIFERGVEVFAGEWTVECVFTLSVALNAGWELRRDDIGTESGFQYPRRSVDKIRIRSLAIWLPCEVRFLTWMSIVTMTSKVKQAPFAVV